MDFSKLKAQKGSNLAKLTEKLDSMNSNAGGQKDERIYRPTFDKKESKGYVVVRFVPPKEGEPFIKKIHHGFQGPGGWYIETSRVTGGFEDDPVAVSNRLYWAKGEAEGNDALKNVAKKRKRKTTYYANVYIEKDKYAPENEGKTFIMEFGPQIFGFIEKAAKPEFEDDEDVKPFDPFDMWNGATLKLKIVGKEIPDQKDPSKKVIVPNYENSEWSAVSEFFAGDDDKKEEVYNTTYDLSEFSKVKPFEELAARFEKVTGEKHNALEDGDPADRVVKEMHETKKLVDEQVDTPEPTRVRESTVQESSGDEDDDVMKMFEDMANN